jgi:hypothetical protein
VTVLEALCGEISNLVLRQETPDAIVLGYITKSARRAGEYAADISNVINFLVGDELTMAGKPARR